MHSNHLLPYDTLTKKKILKRKNKRNTPHHNYNHTDFYSFKSHIYLKNILLQSSTYQQILSFNIKYLLLFTFKLFQMSWLHILIMGKIILKMQWAYKICGKFRINKQVLRKNRIDVSHAQPLLFLLVIAFKIQKIGGCLNKQGVSVSQSMFVQFDKHVKNSWVSGVEYPSSFELNQIYKCNFLKLQDNLDNNYNEMVGYLIDDKVVVIDDIKQQQEDSKVVYFEQGGIVPQQI